MSADSQFPSPPSFHVGHAGGMRVERPRSARNAVLAELAPLPAPPAGTFVLVFRDRESLALRGALLIHHNGQATSFHVASVSGPVLPESLLDAMRRVVAMTHPHLRTTAEVERDLGLQSGVEASWSTFGGWPVDHDGGIGPEEVEVHRILDEPLPYVIAPEQFEEWLRSRP